MAKAAERPTDPRATPEAANAPAPDGADAFAGGMEMFRSMLSAQAEHGRGFVALQEEIVRFYSERLRHNLEALSELGRCVSPAEALELQRRWMSEAVQSYQVEMGRLARISGSPGE
jgi:hypothetical protein